jgi:hypothetical protein
LSRRNNVSKLIGREAAARKKTIDDAWNSLRNVKSDLFSSSLSSVWEEVFMSDQKMAFGNMFELLTCHPHTTAFQQAQLHRRLALDTKCFVFVTRQPKSRGEPSPRPRKKFECQLEG